MATVVWEPVKGQMCDRIGEWVSLEVRLGYPAELLPAPPPPAPRQYRSPPSPRRRPSSDVSRSGPRIGVGPLITIPLGHAAGRPFAAPPSGPPIDVKEPMN